MQPDDQADQLVWADQIPWTAPPVDRAETLNLLTLDDDELLEYAGSLQLETRDLRELVHASLAAVRQLTLQSGRASRRIEALVHELRATVDECRTLRAQLRAIETR